MFHKNFHMACQQSGPGRLTPSGFRTMISAATPHGGRGGGVPIPCASMAARGREGKTETALASSGSVLQERAPATAG